MEIEQPNIKTETTARAIKGSKYLFWNVANNHYAIPLAQVKEILSLPPITTLPRYHPTLHGVFNLRGKIISVADVRHRLGQPGYKNADNPYIIAVELYDYEIGLVVDDIHKVAFIEENAIEAYSDSREIGCEKEYVAGVICHEDNLILLLHLDKLLQIAKL